MPRQRRARRRKPGVKRLAVPARERREARAVLSAVPEARVGLRGVYTSRPRRRRETAPRNVDAPSAGAQCRSVRYRRRPVSSNRYRRVQYRATPRRAQCRSVRSPAWSWMTPSCQPTCSYQYRLSARRTGSRSDLRAPRGSTPPRNNDRAAGSTRRAGRPSWVRGRSLAAAPPRSLADDRGARPRPPRFTADNAGALIARGRSKLATSPPIPRRGRHDGYDGAEAQEPCVHAQALGLPVLHVRFSRCILHPLAQRGPRRLARLRGSAGSRPSIEGRRRSTF